MRRITRDDAMKAVGGADDIAIAQLIGTHATVDELIEAQAWLANDERLMNVGRQLPSARVGELLVEIPTDIEANDQDGETGLDNES